MQIGARCMFRGAILTCKILFYAQPRIRYERRILYEIQNSWMCFKCIWYMWENTWHNSFNFKIGFKIEPKRNNLKLNPFKILSFNAINKTTLLFSWSSWGGDSLRCTYLLLSWEDTGEWIFNAMPHWSLGLLNAMIASATRVQWALIKFGWAFASLFWICLFTSFIVRLNKVIKTVLDLKALDGINMP